MWKNFKEDRNKSEENENNTILREKWHWLSDMERHIYAQWVSIFCAFADLVLLQWMQIHGWLVWAHVIKLGQYIYIASSTPLFFYLQKKNLLTRNTRIMMMDIGFTTSLWGKCIYPRKRWHIQLNNKKKKKKKEPETEKEKLARQQRKTASAKRKTNTKNTSLLLTFLGFQVSLIKMKPLHLPYKIMDHKPYIIHQWFS